MRPLEGRRTTNGYESGVSIHENSEKAEMKETSYFKSFYNRLKRIFRKKNKSYTD